MRCWLAVLVTAVIVSGCGPPGSVSGELLTGNLEPGAGRKSVGVISALGDKFALQKVGITVFGNDYADIPIEAWKIDDLVAAKVGAHLSKRFEVRRITYPKDTFTAYEKPGGLFRDHKAELRKIMQDITASQKCDLYVLVMKGGSMVGNTNQSVSGLGILQAGSGLFLPNVRIHALSTIRVFDGRTFEILAEKRGTMGQQTFMAVIQGPHREVDMAWWPASPQGAQNPKMKDAIVALLDQSLAMTLPELLPVN